MKNAGRTDDAGANECRSPEYKTSVNFCYSAWHGGHVSCNHLYRDSVHYLIYGRITFHAPFNFSSDHAAFAGLVDGRETVGIPVTAS